MRLILVALLLVVSVSAQEQTDRELLVRLKALIDAQLLPVVPPSPTVVHVPCGGAITPAYAALLPGGILTLEPGCVYAETVTLAPTIGASPTLRKTITTQGWVDKGADWDGLVTPTDQPRMATIRGVATTGHVLQVENGEQAGYVELVGLTIEGCPPNGQCDLILLGTDTETDPARMARHISVRQVLLKGSPVFGTRRGLRVEAQDVSITQVWAQDIWIPRQDTQAVASDRGGRRVTVRYSYLQAGAENVILGGSRVPNVDMMPADWLFEDLILHKPLRWQTDGREREVKNLFELKHARNVTARRILMVNTWRYAQDGRAILINYSTNGNCPACGGLENVLLEDIVVLNAVGGINIQGYSYQLDSNNTAKVLGVTLRNAYFAIGNGRPITVANVFGQHDIRVERTTIIHSGTKFFEGDYGIVWLPSPSDGVPLRVPGGPIEGLWLLDNVITRAGDYQVTAPTCAHRAEALGVMRADGCGPFVAADLQVAGNVIGGLPATTAARLNLFRGTGAENIAAVEADMLARLPLRACAEWAPGKGADCSRLAEVFALLSRLPEP